MKTKICTKCNKEKLLSEFNKDCTTENGYKPYCRICAKIYWKNYHKDNKNKILSKKTQYRNNNKEKIKKYRKNYYEKNKQKERKQNQKYFEEYYIKNKNKLIKQGIEYVTKRIKTDPKFCILLTLRSRVSSALKGKTKSLSTMFLIGCEIDYLMYHIQKQFKRGMNWDNYGEWHIDHIRPCASFDLSKAEEQRKCFHFSNLQPLWAKENFKKSDKIL